MVNKELPLIAFAIEPDICIKDLHYAPYVLILTYIRLRLFNLREDGKANFALYKS